MNKYLKNFDFILLISVIAIVIFGIIMIYSASYRTEGISVEVRRQVMFFFTGLILMSIIITIDYEFWGKINIYLYIFTIIILLFVLKNGDIVRGAQSWVNIGPFGKFQPSEIAKLTLIITLAQSISINEKNINSIKVLLKIGAYIGVPWVLILIQPDLGTSLVLIAIIFIMLFWIGINPLYLLGTLLAGSAAAPFLLKEYQWKRLTIFLHPMSDPSGDGWNILQSKIAVGSGQLLGKGFLLGTQSHLQFVPEHTTDFIFSVIGEELGFTGCIVLIVIYFIIIWRGLEIARTARDKFGSLIALGIVSMFMFHILENIGMTIGIMPITGIPLPFISVGGSSLTTNLISVGILLNIKLKSRKTLY